MKKYLIVYGYKGGYGNSEIETDSKINSDLILELRRKIEKKTKIKPVVIMNIIPLEK